EAGRALREGDRRRGQIADPGAVDALTRQRPRARRVRLQTLGPLPRGARVVLAQALHVADLEARALEHVEDVAHVVHLAVGEDVALEELGLRAAPPMLLVRDAVVQEEAAGYQQLVDAGEVVRVVPDPEVLDDADGGGSRRRCRPYAGRGRGRRSRSTRRSGTRSPWHRSASCGASWHHPIPNAPSRTRRRRSPERVQASRAAATMRTPGR